jgi:uncharacterized protein involved in exopolysaccharide biosynthesis
MSTDNHLADYFRGVSAALRRYQWLWLVPTITIGCLGTGYALFRAPKWKAWQALHVRDEITSALNGRFDNTDARKAAQETIIQLAKTRSVIQASLEQMGRPKSLGRVEAWPSSSDIIELQEGLTVSAPKGAEFGKTDVIYLTVQALSPEEAVKLNRAICDQLENHLQQLRNSKAASIVAELTEKLELGQVNLMQATQRLESMEKDVGSDLGELRTLDLTGSGESNLRTALTQINNDLRAARTNETAQRELLELLIAAREDSNQLTATPSRLLDAQPSLKRLTDGLVDAQLKLAEISGTMSEAHPAVRAAAKAEYEIRQQLRIELPAAIRSVEADLKVTAALIASLEKELEQVQARLDHLASLRAPYSNLVAEVAHRTEQLKEIRRALANAQAGQEASATTSLLTRVGQTEVSDFPVGPGRTILIAGSWMGGFMVGLGLVMLAAPVSMFTRGMRMPGGRRATDHDRRARQSGRRSTDVIDREEELAHANQAENRRHSD